jgi:hypothetical protein
MKADRKMDVAIANLSCDRLAKFYSLSLVFTINKTKELRLSQNKRNYTEFKK